MTASIWSPETTPGASSYSAHFQVATFTATEGQVLFNLPYSYTPGMNASSVHVNGVKYEVLLGEYAETSATSITLAQSKACSIGDRVVVAGGVLVNPSMPPDAVSAAALASNTGAELVGTATGQNLADRLDAFGLSSGSSLVGHIASGTGAGARTMQEKARDIKTTADYVVAQGNASSQTAALQAAINQLDGTPSALDDGSLTVSFGNLRLDTELTGNYGLVMLGTRTTGAGSPDAIYPAFGYGALRVVSGGNRNAIIGIADNTLPASTVGYVTAITGYCRLRNNGNIGYGGYFETRMYGTTGACIGAEIDSFNYGAAPTSAVPPLRDGTTSFPNALTIGAGGTQDSSIGIHIVKEGSQPRQFVHGIVINPDAVTATGLYLDASASAGPAVQLVARHRASQLCIQVQTVDAAAGANLWLRYLNSANQIVFGIRQDGQLSFPASLSFSGVGAAGGASALPATPSGYLAVIINGNQRLIPYYQP